MTEVIEVSNGVYGQLEEAADTLDTTISALADDILDRWLRKNLDSIGDEGSDEESQDAGDED